MDVSVTCSKVWDCVCVQWSILEPFSVVTDRLQASNTVTASLVIPLISRLIAASNPDNSLLDMKGEEQCFTDDMIAVRAALHADLVRRYMTEMPQCTLEDFFVAMILDPM